VFALEDIARIAAHLGISEATFADQYLHLSFTAWIKGKFGPSVYKRAKKAGMGIFALKATMHGNNFHVRYRSVFEQQEDALVLVKGGPGSRLFQKACCISEEGQDRAGKPLKVLSRKMQKVFGDFGGHVSIQRSPPRWGEPRFVDKAMEYIGELV
jgi:hypothetical protein